MLGIREPSLTILLILLTSFISDMAFDYFFRQCKTTAPYVHAHEQLRLYFYVLVRYFVILDIQLWKLY